MHFNTEYTSEFAQGALISIPFVAFVCITLVTRVVKKMIYY